MPELRLIDNNGYCVPGSVRDVHPDQEPQARAELKAMAREHAAQWSAWGFDCDARLYRVLPEPTPKSKEATR